MIYALTGAAVIACLAAWLLLQRRSGWTADTDGNDYGTKVDASGSFDFPIAPSAVHYVTKACSSLAGKTSIRISYRITADDGVQFLGAKTGGNGSGPTLYIQRKGDNWSGNGKFETYRWWATFTTPLPITVGEHEIDAPLNGNWTAVMTSSAMTNPAAFQAALADAGRTGFTFGNQEGFGHGVYATGKARFELLSFEAI